MIWIRVVILFVPRSNNLVKRKESIHTHLQRDKCVLQTGILREDSPNNKNWLETVFIKPDRTTASPLFVSILCNVCLFLPYLSKAVLHDAVLCKAECCQ